MKNLLAVAVCWTLLPLFAWGQSNQGFTPDANFGSNQALNPRQLPGPEPRLTPQQARPSRQQQQIDPAPNFGATPEVQRGLPLPQQQRQQLQRQQLQRQQLQRQQLQRQQLQRQQLQRQQLQRQLPQQGTPADQEFLEESALDPQGAN